MMHGSVQLLNLFEQLLYAPVLIVQFFFHFLQLTLLVNAANNLIDVELEAHVTHFLVHITTNNLRGFDRASRRDILLLLI